MHLTSSSEKGAADKMDEMFGSVAVKEAKSGAEYGVNY